jgi:hypothetical protein
MHQGYIFIYKFNKRYLYHRCNVYTHVLLATGCTTTVVYSNNYNRSTCTRVPAQSVPHVRVICNLLLMYNNHRLLHIPVLCTPRISI